MLFGKGCFAGFAWALRWGSWATAGLRVIAFWSQDQGLGLLFKGLRSFLKGSVFKGSLKVPLKALEGFRTLGYKLRAPAKGSFGPPDLLERVPVTPLEGFRMVLGLGYRVRAPV